VSIVRFYVHTSVTMTSAVFWHTVTPCDSCKNSSFGGIYRFHLQVELILSPFYSLQKQCSSLLRPWKHQMLHCRPPRRGQSFDEVTARQQLQGNGQMRWWKFQCKKALFNVRYDAYPHSEQGGVFSSWRWRRCVPPKHLLIQKPHGVSTS
jgi:hypothetical protein